MEIAKDLMTIWEMSRPSLAHFVRKDEIWDRAIAFGYPLSRNPEMIERKLHEGIVPAGVTLCWAQMVQDGEFDMDFKRLVCVSHDYAIPYKVNVLSVRGLGAVPVYACCGVSGCRDGDLKRTRRLLLGERCRKDDALVVASIDRPMTMDLCRTHYATMKANACRRFKDGELAGRSIFEYAYLLFPHTQTENDNGIPERDLEYARMMAARGDAEQD